MAMLYIGKGQGRNFLPLPSEPGQRWELTAQPLHCAMAVMRKHQSKPTWSTIMPPRKAEPLHPNIAIESTALHLPLLFCKIDCK